MSRFFAVRFSIRCAVMSVALAVQACGGNKPAPPKACDAACQDDIALRGIREMMKLAYNFTVQGKPVGAQDATMPCLPTGSVRVSGQASSNSKQGTTTVDLSYDFKACAYTAAIDATPEQNYSLALTGTVAEQGTLAVQPSTNTVIQLQSDDLTVSGTVYQPTVDYDAADCALAATQDGNSVSGTLCGRTVSFVF